MTAQKVLYMLIGPKGSGKTTIGKLIDRHTDITFLQVERVWLSLRPGEDGWKKVEAAIDTMFQTHDKVMIESLGGGEGFGGFHDSLAKKYPLKMIHVAADPDTCLARVKSRNRVDQLDVSDEKVSEYNKIAAAVTHDWDLEIDNNSPVSEAELLTAIQSIEAVRRER